MTSEHHVKYTRGTDNSKVHLWRCACNKNGSNHNWVKLWTEGEKHIEHERLIRKIEISARAAQAACGAYDTALEQSGTECEEMYAVRAAAPIILALELRQIADEIDHEAKKYQDSLVDGLHDARDMLRKRADALDPGDDGDND